MNVYIGATYKDIQYVGAPLVVMQTHLFGLLQSGHSQPTTGHRAQKHHFSTGGASPPVRRPEKWTEQRREK